MEKSQSKPSLFLLLVILGITLGHFKPMDLNKKSHSTEDKYFEGDIVLPDWNARSNGINIRNGVLDLSRRWPGGVVPYEINGKFLSNQTTIIENAFKEFHTRTCVRFKPRTTEKDYISIVNYKNGCFSHIGRLGGRQEVHLESSNCLNDLGVPIHELMHAIGFWHEQARHDRDLFVNVIKENIKPEMAHNFDKKTLQEASTFGEEYDYFSVMHYEANAFSWNQILPTLEAKWSITGPLGNRKGFSAADVRKINAMYCNA